MAVLGRLARLREAERQHAASSAAQAYGAHDKLVQLYARSNEIAAGHAVRREAASGDELGAQLRFMAGLDAIIRDTRQAEAEAQRLSERALLHLRQAERRRDRVTERLGEERRAVDRTNLTRESAVSANLARKLKGS